MNTKRISLSEKEINKYLLRKEELGYSTGCLKQEKQILIYALNRIDGHKINDVIINDYIKKYYSKSSVSVINHSLKSYYNFILTGDYQRKTYRNRPRFEYINNFGDLFNSFIKSFKDKSEYTQEAIGYRINMFCKHLIDNNINKLSDINQDDITNYLNYCLEKYSRCCCNLTTIYLRKFLNYLFDNKIINFSGYHVIPKLISRDNSIPTTYSPDEISQILNSIDRTTKVGKRDFLIICLLAYYGIRIGDITRMKISSFDFVNNKLCFTQHKTKQNIELPLNEIVKSALIDYLKNSRPQISSDNVFITFNPPYREYKSLATIVIKIVDNSNINTNNKKRGAHTFRHSLASNLLRNGASLKTVSLDLGHSYENSSKTYLSIDSQKMKDLSLNFPKNKDEIEKEGEPNE